MYPAACLSNVTPRPATPIFVPACPLSVTPPAPAVPPTHSHPNPPVPPFAPPSVPARYLFFSRPPPRSTHSSTIPLVLSTTHPPTPLQRPPRISVRRTGKRPAIFSPPSHACRVTLFGIKPQPPQAEFLFVCPPPHTLDICPPHAQPPRTTAPSC